MPLAQARTAMYSFNQRLKLYSEPEPWDGWVLKHITLHWRHPGDVADGGDDTYKAVASSTGLKPKQVKAAVEGILTLAAKQMKKHGSFVLADLLHFKLKKMPATKKRIGVNPFTKRRCVFKAKPATNKMTVTPTKELKQCFTR